MRYIVKVLSSKKFYLLTIVLFILLILQSYERRDVITEAADLGVEKTPMKEEMQYIVEMNRLNFDVEHIGQFNYISVELWKKAKEVSAVLMADSKGHFKENWGRFLTILAKEKGIDPFLVYELLKVETGGTFDPELVGPQTAYGQAYGLAQFMENTAPWIAGMADLDYNHELLFDPYFSIKLCIVYLDFLYRLYEDWNHALTAYHRGIYGLETFIDENGDAESWYSLEILANAEEHDLVVNN